MKNLVSYPTIEPWRTRTCQNLRSDHSAAVSENNSEIKYFMEFVFVVSAIKQIDKYIPFKLFTERKWSIVIRYKFQLFNLNFSICQ